MFIHFVSSLDRDECKFKDFLVFKNKSFSEMSYNAKRYIFADNLIQNIKEKPIQKTGFSLTSNNLYLTGRTKYKLYQIQWRLYFERRNLGFCSKQQNRRIKTVYLSIRNENSGIILNLYIHIFSSFYFFSQTLRGKFVCGGVRKRS